MSMQPQPWPEVPAETARVARRAFRKGALAIRARDELGSWYDDEAFGAAYGARGRVSSCRASSPAARRRAAGVRRKRSRPEPAWREPSRQWDVEEYRTIARAAPGRQPRRGPAVVNRPSAARPRPAPGRSGLAHPARPAAPHRWFPAGAAPGPVLAARGAPRRRAVPIAADSARLRRGSRHLLSDGPPRSWRSFWRAAASI